MYGCRPSSLLSAILAAFLVIPAYGQSNGSVTLQGMVVDDKTGDPLPATHVFISGSMNGTTVREDGQFRLTGVTSGAKRLYVSHLGYTPKQIDLVLPPDTTLSFGVRLEPTVIKAKEVTISEERDEEWYEHLDRFKRLFIGTSEAADKCRLLNPKALYFDTAWWGKFEAGATRPLKFENRALGYRVTYYLKEFEVRGDIVRWNGEPVFAPLTPRDSSEAARWTNNRRRAFHGSLRHFMLALLQGRLEEEQFQIFRLPRARAYNHWGRARRLPISREQILGAQTDSLHEINLGGVLEIRYDGAPETPSYVEWAKKHRDIRDHQTSQIRLNEHPIHVDRHGEIVEPYGATLYQYLAFRQRLAMLLPRGYRPSETAFAASTSNQ